MFYLYRAPFQTHFFGTLPLAWKSGPLSSTDACTNLEVDLSDEHRDEKKANQGENFGEGHAWIFQSKRNLLTDSPSAPYQSVKTVKVRPTYKARAE